MSDQGGYIHTNAQLDVKEEAALSPGWQLERQPPRVHCARCIDGDGGEVCTAGEITQRQSLDLGKVAEALPSNQNALVR